MVVNKKFSFLALFVILAIISFACNLPINNSNEVSAPVQEPAVQAPTVQEQVLPTEIPTTPVEPIIEAEPAPIETQTETEEFVLVDPVGDELEVVESYFKQTDSLVDIAYLLRNNHQEMSLVNINSQIKVTDTEGVEIDTVEILIDFLKPGETTEISDRVWAGDQQFETVSMESTYQLSNQTEFDVPLEVINTRTYFDEQFNDYIITGVLKNASPDLYLDMGLQFISRDATGVINDSSISNVPFVPGNDQVGFKIYAKLDEPPQNYKVYVRKQSWSDIDINSERMKELQLINYKFTTYQDIVGGGFLVKNLTDKILDGFTFSLNFYAADDSICTDVTNFAFVLFPGQTIGYSPGEISLPGDCVPTYYTLFVYPNQIVDHQLLSNPLTAENVVYVNEPDPYVSLTIVNSHNQSISDPTISVLLYNENDEIIGGGYAYGETLPANGRYDMALWVNPTGNQVPARIEAYPSISFWSTIGE